MLQETAVIANNLGPSLRRWRALNRVKQESLASDFGVSQARISRWESGDSVPDAVHARKLATLLHARPSSAADRALLDLVSGSVGPVHLVCDLTHRLLAVSPARAQNWHLPLSDLMGRPLWRYASDGIRDMEHRLPDKGWYEPLAPDICYWTECAVFPELMIPESYLRISRLPLSNGGFARLVREAMPAAA